MSRLLLLVVVSVMAFVSADNEKTFGFLFDRLFNPCNSDPCEYGYCDPGRWFRDFECVCGPGFTGATCSENIDDCSDSLCDPGRCIDGVNGYTCCCPENYVGNQSCIEAALVGDACGSQAVCVVDNSECRNGTDEAVCGCEAGYSSDSTSEVCHAVCNTTPTTTHRCTTQLSRRTATSYDTTRFFRTACIFDCPDDNYGTDFQEFPGYLLSGWNTEQMPFTTAEDCKQACIDATEFVCVSCEYDADTCFLSMEDASSKPDAYRINGNFIHYQRNCA